MALRGHVFSKQLFTSDCFALFIDTFLAKNNGIVKGCELSNTTNSIDLTDGFFCIGGRFLQEEGGSTFNIEASTQNDIYCKLICEIDLTKENTVSELKQAQYKILQSVEGYPSLQQEDTTNEGTTYQFEFAQFKVTESGIEDFIDKRTTLNFNSIYAEIRRNINTFLSQQNITTKEKINELVADLKTYCDTAKEVLDENVALNLLNLINTKSDIPTSYSLTITPEQWVQNEEMQLYEYNVEDTNITANHKVEGALHLESQGKLGSSVIESCNGGYKIKATELPTESVTMDIVIILTNPVSTGGEEV